MNSIKLLLSASAFAAVCAAQDTCATAIAVVDGANGTFSNVGMTNSSTGEGAPTACLSSNFQNDIWLAYTATGTGNTTFSTCSMASGDTVMAVYSGSCGALNQLGCNDDSCSLRSSLTISTVANTTYYIRLDTYGSSTLSNFTLDITPPSMPAYPNDECTGAVALNLGSNGPFQSTSAGGYSAASTSQPAFSCGSGGSDLWYSFTAAYTVPHRFKTCGSAFDTVIEVYDACGGTSLGCNDDSCGLQSGITVSLTASSTYYVRVGGFNGASGTFNLDVVLGLDTGSITNLGLGCGSATFSVTGAPSIGGTINANLTNTVGVPFIGIDLVPGSGTFCGSCNVGSGWGLPMFGSSYSLTVPADASFIGLPVYLQGADFFGVGGCANPQLNLTDTYHIIFN